MFHFEFCTAEALDSGSSTFPGDAVDQFLTYLSMSAELDYVGGYDESGGAYFGTATLIELGDDDRLACALVEAAAYGRETIDVDSYRDVAAVILWGSDYKWWGDSETFASVEEAREAYERFETAYGEWCDADDDEVSAQEDDTFASEIRQAELWGEAFGTAE